MVPVQSPDAPKTRAECLSLAAWARVLSQTAATEARRAAWAEIAARWEALAEKSPESEGGERS
jgi:hypothetical protein